MFSMEHTLEDNYFCLTINMYIKYYEKLPIVMNSDIYMVTPNLYYFHHQYISKSNTFLAYNTVVKMLNQYFTTY